MSYFYGKIGMFLSQGQGAFTFRYLKSDATFTFSVSNLNSTLGLYLEALENRPDLCVGNLSERNLNN